MLLLRDIPTAELRRMIRATAAVAGEESQALVLLHRELRRRRCDRQGRSEPEELAFYRAVFRDAKSLP